MKTKDLLTALTLTALAVLAACSRDKNSDSPSPTPAGDAASQPVMAVRLDSVIAVYTSLDEAGSRETLNRFGREMAALRDVTGDTRPTEQWAVDFASGPVAGMFGPAVMEVFPGPVELLSAEGAARMRSLGVDIPEAVGVTLPYSQSMIFVGDSIVLVSLNHWLGAGHPAYRGFPAYVSRLKTPERLSIDFAEALIGRANPYTPEEGRDNVLSRMLYEGALMAAVMEVTGADEAAVMGWSSGEHDTAVKAERQAWERLLTQKMLFSGDTQLQERLTGPAPSTSVLSPEFPGRMGRWIGLRIVESLRRNEPGLTYAELLSPQLYSGENVLARSRYTP